MRKILTTLLVFVIGLSFGQITVDVRSTGAVGDSLTLNTTAIQHAIDSVYNSGGGTVLITSGNYLTGTIILKSNITLRITTDATLQMTTNYNLLPALPYNTPSWNDDYTNRCLIFAEDAHNIRFTGGGSVNANGFNPGWLTYSVHNRPIGLRLHAIDSLAIDSVFFNSAPQWMASIFECTNVHIHDASISNQGSNSNDGFDIDCCRNVLVENCVFDTWDDPVPIKTHATSICRDVTVRNCKISTYERAVKVGCESFGPLVNIRFENIDVVPTAHPVSIAHPFNTIYIAIADGGSADSIFFEHIHISTPSETALYIKLCMRDFQYDHNIPPPLPKYLRNVWINDVTGAVNSTTMPCSISGVTGYPVENIHLSNIHITVPGGGPVGYTNVSDQLPTRPEHNVWEDSLPVYGLYVRHVNGLYMDSVCFDTLAYDQRSLYYFDDTTRIPNIIPCSAYDFTSTISDIFEPGITLYPNPANETVSLNNLPRQAEFVSLYSITGANIQTVPATGKNSISLRLSEYSSGMYFISLTGKNYSYTTKLVIAR